MALKISGIPVVQSVAKPEAPPEDWPHSMYKGEPTNKTPVKSLDDYSDAINPSKTDLGNVAQLIANSPDEEYLKKVASELSPKISLAASAQGATQAMKGFASALASAQIAQVAEDEFVIENKADVKAAHKPQLGLSQVQADVNELIHLEGKLLELEVPQMLKRKEELRKALVSQIGEADPNKVVLLAGTEGGSVEFSVCSKEFKLGDKGKLASKLGEEVFFEIASFSITALKKVLSENELGEVGQYVQTSGRSVKVTPKVVAQ